MIRLGVNIDHIATLRQLRGTPYPSLLQAAQICEQSGAEQITVHLREDRRHIQPDDVKILRKHLKVPLNLEMAATDAMTRFACSMGPDWACLVPEKRQEVTTEGGLDLSKAKSRVAKTISSLKKKNIKVSLFIEPTAKMVKLSADLGADAVEFHTGAYAISYLKNPARTLKALPAILKVAQAAKDAGLHVHAGHGLDYVNVRALSEHSVFEEFNIGHSIVCRASLVGLSQAVREMVSAIQAP